MTYNLLCFSKKEFLCQILSRKVLRSKFSKLNNSFNYLLLSEHAYPLRYTQFCNHCYFEYEGEGRANVEFKIKEPNYNESSYSLIKQFYEFSWIFANC